MSEKEIKIEEIQDQTEAQETSENIDEVTTESTIDISVEEQLTQDLATEKDKFLRLFAEFENYKRRTSKERMELFKTANTDVMSAMLPVLDDFDRAWIEIEKSNDKDLKTGISLISNKLKITLENKGLTLLEVRKGDAFNADFHEAITQIPAPSNDMKGKIIDVIE